MFLPYKPELNWGRGTAVSALEKVGVGRGTSPSVLQVQSGPAPRSIFKRPTFGSKMGAMSLDHAWGAIMPTCAL